MTPMNKTEHGHQHNGEQDQEERHLRGPYWRRVHHNLYFWVAMLVMPVVIVNVVDFADTVLSAMRYEFGGYEEGEAGTKGK